MSTADSAIPEVAPKPEPESRPEPRSSVGERLVMGAERYGLVVMFAIVVVLFSVLPSTSGSFPSSANFENITGNQSVLALIALAAIVPLVCGEFDISVGSILSLSTVVTAHAVSSWGFPIVFAILAGVVAGGLVGLVNGFLVAKVRVNSLIATLAVGTILTGFTLAISSTPIIEGVPDAFTTFGTGDWFGIPRPFFVLIFVAFLLWFLLEQTPMGRQLHAIGSSITASRLVGVPVERLVLSSYVVSGLISGAAGVLQLARSGVGDPNVGTSFLLPAIAAAFLGATTIRPGRFNVMGTIVAIFFLAVVISGLSIAGAEAWLQSVINGGALLAGIAISTVIARRRERAA